jgi:hypothetical protein
MTIDRLLDLWNDSNEPSWTASTAANQKSRIALTKADPIAKVLLVRLAAVAGGRWPVAGGRWPTRLLRADSGEGSIWNQHQDLRAAVSWASGCERWSGCKLDVTRRIRDACPINRAPADDCSESGRR